jgi:hypothetical protein
VTVVENSCNSVRLRDKQPQQEVETEGGHFETGAIVAEQNPPALMKFATHSSPHASTTASHKPLAQCFHAA